MTLEQALINYLSEQPNFTSVLGNLPQMRFYPLTLPQPIIYPSMTWNVMNSMGQVAHGDQPTNTRTRNTSMQLTAFVKVYRDGSKLRGVLWELLHGFRGLMADVSIQHMFLTDQPLLYEPSTQVYQYISDLSAMWQEVT